MRARRRACARVKLRGAFASFCTHHLAACSCQNCSERGGTWGGDAAAAGRKVVSGRLHRAAHTKQQLQSHLGMFRSREAAASIIGAAHRRRSSRRYTALTPAWSSPLQLHRRSYCYSGTAGRGVWLGTALRHAALTPTASAASILLETQSGFIEKSRSHEEGAREGKAARRAAPLPMTGEPTGLRQGERLSGVLQRLLVGLRMPFCIKASAAGEPVVGLNCSNESSCSW